MNAMDIFKVVDQMMAKLAGDTANTNTNTKTYPGLETEWPTIKSFNKKYGKKIAKQKDALRAAGMYSPEFGPAKPEAKRAYLKKVL